MSDFRKDVEAVLVACGYKITGRESFVEDPFKFVLEARKGAYVVTISEKPCDQSL